MLYILDEDPRRIDSGGKGNFLYVDKLFNTFHGEKCWHKKLIVFRLMRMLQVEEAYSDKWLSTPVGLHHVTVDMLHHFPIDELGCPSELVESIVTNRRRDVVRYTDWHNSERKDGRKTPYPDKLVLKLYGRDEFLHNSDNINRSVSRAYNYKPTFPECMLVVRYDRAGKEIGRQIKTLKEGSQKC